MKVRLETDAIPLLDGALYCSEAGVESSLLPANARVGLWVEDADRASLHPKWPLLIDPQTGDLLTQTCSWLGTASSTFVTMVMYDDLD